MSDESIANTNESVTLQEIVQEQDRVEECANAVLGGSDDTNCTYEKGYLGRQALYACMDCCKPNVEAGVCLACCLECHADHNLVELYTKRNFRCDCGNSKMTNECNLYQDKEPLNNGNKYNHNFSGIYCTCRRPYPDPDAEEEEEMIQCVICEDWLHDKHCGSKLTPDSGEYEDFTCASCMQKAPVLAPYAQAWAIVEPEIDVESSLDEGSTSGCCEMAAGQKRVAAPEESSVLPVKRQHTNAEADSSSGPGVDTAQVASTSLSLTAWSDGDACRWSGLPSSAASATGVFWPEGWRKALCRCAPCKSRLADASLDFLLSVEDSLAWYEAAASTKSSSTIERGMQAFSQMGHVQQIELAAGYSSMKEALSEHLKKLAETKTVVTKEDVESFFAAFNKKKNAPHMQQNCK